MAGRKLGTRHQEDIKTKIKGSQLKNLLEEHALTGFYNGVEVSTSRIDAAKFLLNKILSNPATDVNQKFEGDVTVRWST